MTPDYDPVKLHEPITKQTIVYTKVIKEIICTLLFKTFVHEFTFVW